MFIIKISVFILTLAASSCIYSRDVGGIVSAEHMVDSERYALKDHFVKNLVEDYNEFELDDETRRKLDERIQIFQNSQIPLRKSRVKRNVGNENVISPTEMGVHVFKGFQENASIPINFPVDFCLFKVNEEIFAAALHYENNSISNENDMKLTIFKKEYDLFVKYYEYNESLSTSALDCVSTVYGFAFVTASTKVEENKQLEAVIDGRGSPVFQITENYEVRIVQMFTASNLFAMQLWSYGNDIYLAQTFQNLNNPDSINTKCPIYKWSGYNFDIIDELICYNAVRLERFTVFQHLFIAVANHMDNNGTTTTFSYIYKYDTSSEKFVIFQKLLTNAIIDIKYFYFDIDHIREHFLIAANLYEIDEKKNRKYDCNTIIYKYINNFFVPFQTLQLNRVKKILPVKGAKGEFILLVAFEEDDTQIYQYNGWKLTESTIDYTGDVFGKGVSNMRSYSNIVNGTTFIVSANKRSYEEEYNIYVPKFTFQNNINYFYKDILKWSEENIQQISQYNINELVEQIMKLPVPENNTISINGNLEVHNSIIYNLEASELYTPSATLDYNFIANLNSIHTKARELREKLSNIEEELTKILFSESQVRGESNLDEVGESDPTLQPNVFDIIEVEELIIDESLNCELINTNPVANLMHSTDDFSNLYVHVNNHITVADNFTVTHINNITFNEANVLIHGKDQVLVGALHSNELFVNKLNLPNMPIVESSYRNTETIDEIIVQNLTLMGLINGIDLDTINTHALKHNVNDQYLTANFNISLLKAQQFVTNGFPISGENFDNLIKLSDSNSGVIEINQDIQFVEPLIVNELFVSDRINNVNVRRDGNLNILLKRFNELQIITGEKNFESVKLLKSIYLQGKINSSSLENMNPITTVAKDIVIDGDVEIMGNVTIKSLLEGFNLYGQNATYNVQELISNGLKLNEITSAGINFNFLQPIQINNMITNRINENIDPNDFVIADEIQYISGRKIFHSNLNVSNGYCEMGEINNINVRELNNTVLMKTGQQEIEGRIHFEKIVAYNTLARSTVRADNTVLQNFLTFDTEQVIQSNVLFSGNVSVMDSLEVNKLGTTAGTERIGEFNFDDLIKDTVCLNAENVDKEIIITGDKFFNNCVVTNIIVNPENFTINDFQLDFLNSSFAYINDDIIFSEAITFFKNISITNIIFNKSINNIPKDEFGNNWLLAELNQTFTAPQKFSDLIADDMVALTGTLNNIRLDDLYSNAYFVDRDENFENITFTDGLVSNQPVYMGGKINGIDLSTDVLLKGVYEYQEIDELYVGKDLNVSQKIFISESLNSIDYSNLINFIFSQNVENIHVHGSAEFWYDPEVAYINSINLNEISNNVWFNDMPVVLTNSVQLGSAQFHNDIYFNNTVNSVNVLNLNERYFSLTKEQTIIAFMEFSNEVIFEHNFYANHIYLNGTVTGLKSNIGFPIDYFDAFVLKRDVDQFVTGKWTIIHADITDDLESILINGLDFSTDLFRLDWVTNNITGRKQFQDVHVGTMYCLEPPCIIQDTDVFEWIQNSVEASGNYTIQGITKLESPVFFQDIAVYGVVDNITFTPDTLLTKSQDQVINSNTIINTVDQQYRTLMLSTFHTLQVNNINSISVMDFVNNIVKNDDEYPVLINSSLIFNDVLEIDDLNLNNHNIYGVNLSNLIRELDYSNRVAAYENKLQLLQQVTDDVVESYKDQPKFLVHYDIRQSIKGNYSRSVFLPVSGDINFLITLTSQYADYFSIIIFWRYNPVKNSFVIDNQPLPGIASSNIVNIDKIEYDNDSYLIVEIYDAATNNYIQYIFGYYQNEFRNIYQFETKLSNKLIAIKINNLNCIGIYSDNLNNLLLKCLNIDSENQYIFNDIQILNTEPVKQAIGKNHIVVATNNDAVSIWEKFYKDSDLFNFKQTINIHNPSCIDSIFYQGYYYLAVCSDKIENTVHYGTVEIFRSKLYSTYAHFETISIKIPHQIKFSILPSNELMFYTLTDNPTEPLNIYTYAGQSGFTEYLTVSVLPQGSELELLQLRSAGKEMLSIVASSEIVIVEAIMNN